MGELVLESARIREQNSRMYLIMICSSLWITFKISVRRMMEPGFLLSTRGHRFLITILNRGYSLLGFCLMLYLISSTKHFEAKLLRS